MGTRPDITFTVKKTSQYLEKPSKIHWNANFQIFKENNRYGIFQSNRIITLKHSAMQITLQTLKLGNCFCIKTKRFCNWYSISQQTVTRLLKYIGPSQIVKKIIWMKSLINDVAMFKNLITSFYVDNLSVIKFIKNPKF